jgi:hypothetical protein
VGPPHVVVHRRARAAARRCGRIASGSGRATVGPPVPIVPQSVTRDTVA